MFSGFPRRGKRLQEVHAQAGKTEGQYVFTMWERAAESSCAGRRVRRSMCFHPVEKASRRSLRGQKGQRKVSAQSLLYFRNNEKIQWKNDGKIKENQLQIPARDANVAVVLQETFSAREMPKRRISQI